MSTKTFTGPRTRLTAKELIKLSEIIDSYVTVGNFSNQHNLPPASIHKLYNGISDTCSEDLAIRLRELIKQLS